MLQFIFNLLSDVVRTAAPVTYDVAFLGVVEPGSVRPTHTAPESSTQSPPSESNFQRGGGGTPQRENSTEEVNPSRNSPRTPWKRHLLCSAWPVLGEPLAALHGATVPPSGRAWGLPASPRGPGLRGDEGHGLV